jgi:membrane fusion protein (multidrug efflux system)
MVSCQKKDQKQSPQGPPPKKPANSQAWIATRQAVGEKLILPGSITAWEYTDVHPEIPGLISQVLFSDGQKVTKGQLLARLNDADPLSRLNKLKVQREIALQTEKRQKELLSSRAIGQAEYDQALLQLRSIEADMDILKTEIEKHQIRAPFAGTMGIRQVSPGSYVTPASVLVSLSDLTRTKLRFSVPERYIPLVRNGQIVSFRVSSSEELFEARIVSRESSLDPTSRSLTFLGEVLDKSDKLLQGLYAEVILQIDKSNSGFLVPSQAIIPQARDKKILVLKEGLAEFRSVRLGTRDSARVEILSGVEEGDTILTTGLMGIKPGTPVQVQTILNGR